MRKLVLVLGLAFVASCGGSDSSTNPLSLAGTYNLHSVNGFGLPFTIQAANPKVEILSDQIIASANGTFGESGSYRVTDGTSVTTTTITDAGTYTVSGTVTFRFNSDGSMGTGTLSGNSFTVAESGASFVYVKQ